MSQFALDELRLRRLYPRRAGASSPTLDPEVVLDRVLDVAREITGARYAALGILDEEKRELEQFLTAGIDEERGARSARCPAGAACSAC